MSIPPVRRFFHWIPAILAILMIGFESTAAMSAENTSRWLLPVWVHLFGPISPGHWATIHHAIRKTGHFTGYGLVSFCFFHGWRKSLKIVSGGVRLLWMRCSLLAIGCTIMLASADEFHQTFLPGRTGRVADVGIDTCGALATQLLILALMPLLIPRPKEHFLPALAPEIGGLRDT